MCMHINPRAPACTPKSGVLLKRSLLNRKPFNLLLRHRFTNNVVARSLIAAGRSEPPRIWTPTKKWWRMVWFSWYRGNRSRNHWPRDSIEGEGYSVGFFLLKWDSRTFIDLIRIRATRDARATLSSLNEKPGNDSRGSPRQGSDPSICSFSNYEEITAPIQREKVFREQSTLPRGSRYNNHGGFARVADVIQASRKKGLTHGISPTTSCASHDNVHSVVGIPAMHEKIKTFFRRFWEIMKAL